MTYPRAVTSQEPPEIFRSLDYRAYLREMYAYRRRSEYGFSHRAFCRRVGLRSSNYLNLVMKGQRNLSAEMAPRFAAAAGLEGQEAEYFCDLVGFNQANTADERERCYARLARFKRYREVHRLEQAQAAYHGEWYVPAIRELAAREDFQDDPRWIAARLRPAITPEQASEALRVLCELELLVERDGRLQQSHEIVSTGRGPLGHHIVRYHRMMMDRAASSLDEMPREDREVSSLTLCVSRSAEEAIRARVREFRAQLLQLAELDGEPERVVQLNFQLFPLTRREDEIP